MLDLKNAMKINCILCNCWMLQMPKNVHTLLEKPRLPLQKSPFYSNYTVYSYYVNRFKDCINHRCFWCWSKLNMKKCSKVMKCKKCNAWSEVLHLRKYPDAGYCFPSLKVTRRRSSCMGMVLFNIKIKL